jgi:signal peptidase II
MTSFKAWFGRAWLVLAVAAVVVGLDRWSKEWARATLPKGVRIPVVGEWLMWQHVDNYGAAFGLFQNANVVFMIVAIVISTAMLIYIRYLPSEGWFLRLLLGLMLGGALGNLLDRVTQGFVTDFILMGIPGRFYWPNYNVADMGIVGGTVGLAIVVLWEDLFARKHPATDPAEDSPQAE